MNIADKLKLVAKEIRHGLRLSPMHIIFKRLERRGFEPKKLNALEVFGSDGRGHTMVINSLVDSLTIWEIRPECEPILKRRFPESEFKITDSYQEIKKTPAKYDLVVVDNSFRFVVLNHYEHFDLFPDIFRVLSDPAVIILNVAPKVLPNQNTDSLRMRQRQRFYNVEDPTNISFDEIEETYRALAAQNGWKVEWINFLRRWPNNCYYLVLELRLNPAGIGEPDTLQTNEHDS